MKCIKKKVEKWKVILVDGLQRDVQSSSGGPGLTKSCYTCEMRKKSLSYFLRLDVHGWDEGLTADNYLRNPRASGWLASSCPWARVQNFGLYQIKGRQIII